MSKRYQLCVTDPKTQLTRVMRHVKVEEGLNMVEKRKAEPVLCDATGDLLGFELRPKLRPVAQTVLGKRCEGVRAERPPVASNTAFSKVEVEAIAGLRGESATARLSKDAKAERARWGQPEQDLVELAEQKLAVYKSVH